ncbi:MAG: hypothetical protein COS08_06475 [Euryarchaeota archaeon CG01_land_8_20_14_3_00_38_12]|nr:MAG: hypothetical protein COS08_06475 [Euryarchaeota archaeon CG01_land_8_20_14_3_00_38_12]
MVEQLLGTSKIYEVNFASERKIRDFPLSARILLSKIRERKEFGTNSLQRANFCYPKICNMKNCLFQRAIFAPKQE